MLRLDRHRSTLHVRALTGPIGYWHSGTQMTPHPHSRVSWTGVISLPEVIHQDYVGFWLVLFNIHEEGLITTHANGGRGRRLDATADRADLRRHRGPDIKAHQYR